MTASELRIGNYISHPNAEVDTVQEIVYSHEEYAIKPTNYHIAYWLIHEGAEIIKPIKLTEEWLLKLGFRCDKNLYILYINDWTYLEVSLSWFCELSINKHSFPIVHLQYVHQLQNIYFALTGNEIKIIKPKPLTE